jgi:Rrf2 family protein
LKISALEEYGLRCLVQLARERCEPGGGRTLSARQVAEREGLTLEYAAQILTDLRRAGLVRSVRGVHGGFLLARPAAEISVGHLFRAFDGPLADNLCESYTGNRDVCTHSEACSVRPVWSELQRRLYGFLDGVTVADIAVGGVPSTAQVVPLVSVRRAGAAKT